MNNSNATSDFLSRAPPPTRESNTVASLVYLTFAMITAFLFALIMSKFQRQLRNHQQRVHGGV